MRPLAFIVLGAVIGAASTGGVQLLLMHRKRQRERMVAARAMLTNVNNCASTLQSVATTGLFPWYLGLKESVETWREFRAAFIGAVSALEWLKLDGFFDSMARLAQFAEPGQRCNRGFYESIAEELKEVPEIEEIIYMHAAWGRAEKKRVLAGLQVAPKEAADGGRHPRLLEALLAVISRG